MRTLFEKARYTLYKLPAWLRPEGFRKKKHDYYMRLINPQTGAAITGESNNPSFSTGGRYTSVLFDELSKWESTDESAWTAAGDATPSRIAVSTANGAGGQFYKLVTDGKTRKITLHWSKHPLKAKGLYCKFPKPLEASDVVNESSWIGLRSVWYDKETERRTANEVAQDLDINYLGAGNPYFMGRAFSRLQILLKTPREVKALLGLEYGSLVLNEVTTKESSVFVFELPRKDCQYVVSVDVAEGKEDGDFSVVKVLNRMTLSTAASFFTDLDEVQLSRFVVAITKYYTFEGVEEPWWAVEANSLGLAVFDLCTEIYDLPNPFMMPRYDVAKQSISYRKGWWTGKDSRRALTSGITKWLLDGVGWTDVRCVGEMLTFVKDKNGKPQAMNGNFDDEVMCFGIGLQVHYLLPMDEVEEYNLVDVLRKRVGFSQTVVDSERFPISDPEPTLEEACLATLEGKRDLRDQIGFSEDLVGAFYDY